MIWTATARLSTRPQLDRRISFTHSQQHQLDSFILPVPTRCFLAVPWTCAGPIAYSSRARPCRPMWWDVSVRESSTAAEASSNNADNYSIHCITHEARRIVHSLSPAVSFTPSGLTLSANPHCLVPDTSGCQDHTSTITSLTASDQAFPSPAPRGC